jgi:hypothetical protein
MAICYNMGKLPVRKTHSQAMGFRNGRSIIELPAIGGTIPAEVILKFPVAIYVAEEEDEVTQVHVCPDAAASLASTKDS